MTGMSELLRIRARTEGWRGGIEAAARLTLQHRGRIGFAELASCIRALTWQDAPTWRHKKRGSTYRIAGQGSLQTDKPLEDMADLIAYVGIDGKMWFRTPEEFYDGRFERMSDDAQQSADQQTEK
jgi:hypothetical protein